MMVSSTTAVHPGETASNKAETSYSHTLDVARIDEDGDSKGSPSQKSNWLETREARIYDQLVSDQLDSASKSYNGSSFSTLLSNLLNPKDSSSIDESKLLIVLRTLSRKLGKISQDALTPIVLALTGVVQWSQLSSRVTDSYVQFFSVLISGNPKWWPEVAKKIISQFCDAGLDLAPHHLVLQNIIQIVPTSIGSLAGIVAQQFPHKQSPTTEIISYVSNSLQLVEYAPEQLHDIWELVIQKVVELDVECEDPEELLKKRMNSYSESDSSDSSGEDEDEDEDKEDADAGGGASDTDLESEDSGYDSNSDSATDVETDDESDAEGDTTISSTSLKRLSADESISSKRLRIDDIADGEQLTGVELEMALSTQQDDMRTKADALLSHILQVLASKFSEDAVRSGRATPLFKVLLQIFKDIVLPTSRSQAVQFIWFFVTHSHRDLLASFLSLLLESAMSTSLAYDIRMRSMQYVASFVARAKGLSRQQIVFVVKFLADWVQRFIRERESEVDESLSMAKFRMFYSAVQALFYIFVFRHSMLRVESEKGSQWEANLDKLFQQAINTKFNPLQYCQPEVVAMFARISQDEEVASCYSIIERNRWGRFRTSEGGSAGYTGASNGLFSNNRDSKLYDSFLPFQPLRFRKSKKFFVDMYEKWSEVDFSDSDTEREREMEREDSSSDDDDDTSSLSD